jgi:hypothetical protein
MTQVLNPGGKDADPSAQFGWSLAAWKSGLAVGAPGKVLGWGGPW